MAYSKRFLKKKKMNRWKEFCSNLNKETPCSQIWSQISRFNNVKVRRSYSVDQEEASIILDSLAPSWSVEERSKISKRDDRHFLSLAFSSNELRSKISKRDDRHFLSLAFSSNELNQALEVVKETTPDIDHISYRLLHILPLNVKDLLLDIYA
ncbi:hypothetical protein QE152_g9492 [Popillia japonica]|uniref:Uncharacterized protein n=1 Tax=Popillia japonica TaxID=7064 RepID=A0AAW1LY96_POPJA